MSSVRLAGARLALERLRGSGVGWGAAVLVTGAVVVVALARDVGSPRERLELVTAAWLGWALPALSAVTVTRALGGGPLRRGLWPLLRHGAGAGEAALGFAWTLGLGVGLLTALGGLSAAWLSGAGLRAVDAAGLVGHLVLAGPCYCVWLAWASSWGGGSTGRLLWLAADWLLGATPWAVATLFPRGHWLARVEPTGRAPLGGPSALLGLGVLTLVGMAALWRRAARAPRR